MEISGILKVTLRIVKDEIAILRADFEANAQRAKDGNHDNHTL